MTGAPRHDADDPIECAAWWDARLRLPTADDGDRSRFAAWLETPAHRRAYDELQGSLSMLREASTGHPELRAMRDAAREASAASDRWWRYAGAAAVLMVSIGGVTSLIERESGLRTDVRVADQTNPVPLAGVRTAGQMYETAIGERSTVTLADGSRLTLNTASRVSVVLGPHRRDLVVLAGQALFEVAHDQARPFIVRAGDRTVTAHGTIFDVRLRPGGVEVTLIEGRVTVAEAATGSPLNRIADLTAGQQFMSAGTDAAVRSIDVEKETSWRDGRVFFEDQPLPAAVQEMNRYSPLRIVADPALAGLRINGMFKAGQQVGFARTIEAYLPVEARMVNDNRIELRPRR